LAEALLAHVDDHGHAAAPLDLGAIVGDVVVDVAVEESPPRIARGPDDVVALAGAHEDRVLGEAGRLRHRVAVRRDDLERLARRMLEGAIMPPIDMPTRWADEIS
jgi:hypothetical protein